MPDVESKQLSRQTILVMDDVEMNRSIVTKVFKDVYHVFTAENGAVGMEILHQHEVDLVLLDIVMPVMDGFAVLQAMKSEKRLEDIPVIVITGEVERAEKQALDLGADDFIEQPYDSLGADDFIEQPYDSYIMRKRVENLIDRYNLRKLRRATTELKKEQNLLAGLGIAYWEWTPENGAYHSAEYEKYAISQMEEEKIWDVEDPFAYVHPDDVPLMKKFMQKYPDDEIKKSAVVRCKMRDGSYRWTEMFSFVETFVDGQLKRLVSAMRDVDKEWISSFAVEQKNLELNHIIDSTSGGVITYLVGDVLTLTSATKRLTDSLGYSDEEMETAQTYDGYDFIFPSDVGIVKEKLLQVADGNKSALVAYRIRKKNHTYKWFRASLYPAGEVDGRPKVYAVLTDIEEINADYEDALNQTNEMVVVADWDSREILYLNQAAASIGGKNKLELFGKKCSQIAQHCDECCSYCFKDDLTYDELTIRPMAVGKKYFLTKGKRMLWNGREAFVEYVSDITAQHNMTERAVFERNLLTSATRVLFPLCIISNLTQNTYNIIEYDAFNTKKAASDGCFDELIKIGASTIPEPDRQAFISAFSRENLLKAYAAGVTMVPLVHRQNGDDGVIHWNRTTVVFADQLFDGDLYTITFTDNVDDQKKNEAMLQTALTEAERANMAKTAFLSRVSHDMRTPLNGILGLTTILKETVTDETITGDLLEMELSGKYLLNLINDTLDVSRIENGKLELHPTVCDGRNLFNNVLSLVKTNAKSKKIQLHITADNMPFTMLYVDSGRIEQVLMNVVGNAVKFTPENGRIDITLENIAIEDGIITDRVEVRDYGIGMSQAFLPHIFEAFSQEDTTRTSSNQGTGLGMAITRQLIQLMDGDISVESELGKGSCFTIMIKLPIATEEQIETWKKSRISVDNGIGLANKRILLCEDHPLNTKIAMKLLTTKGMLVEHAENGKIAVDMFSHSEINYFDAVLMDIRMPVMDGIDAAKAIRSLPRRDAQTVPIIAMTANAFAEDIRQTKNAGMNAHLSKPIQTEVMYETLTKLLKVDRDLRR